MLVGTCREPTFDPEQAWVGLMWAFSRRDWHRVANQAVRFLSWLDQGGTPPNIAGEIPVHAIWNWSLARHACRLALAQAKEHGVPDPLTVLDPPLDSTPGS